MSKEQIKNLVNYGVKKAAYCPILGIDAKGNEIYGNPITLPGLREFGGAPAGETSSIYADGGILITISANNGYAGTLSFTELDNDFRMYALGEFEDGSNVMYEHNAAQGKEFALLLEFANDVRDTRHAFFKCKIDRPEVAGATAGDGGSITANYQNSNFTAMPRADGVVKNKTKVNTLSTVYENWFLTPPTVAPAMVKKSDPISAISAPAGAVIARISFIVQAIGGAEVTYQWYSTVDPQAAGTQIAGETADQLDIPGSTAVETWFYCVASAPGLEPIKSGFTHLTVT